MDSPQVDPPQEVVAPSTDGVPQSGEDAVVKAAEENPELLGSNDDSAVQAEAAPEVAADPAAIEYTSLSDVKLDDLSGDIRQHVEPIMALVQNEVASLKSQKDSFEAAKNEFTELIDAMESSGYDVKPLQSKIEEQSTFINTMSENMIDTAWQAFTTTHPEFDGIPQQARDLFAKELEKLFERHDGKTVLDRMNGAYDYALWKSGVDRTTLSTERGTPASGSIPPKAPPVVNIDAKKQAAIADGRIATSAPVRSIDEVTWDDVLNRHAHLLDR